MRIANLSSCYSPLLAVVAPEAEAEPSPRHVPLSAALPSTPLTTWIIVSVFGAKNPYHSHYSTRFTVLVLIFILMCSSSFTQYITNLKIFGRFYA